MGCQLPSGRIYGSVRSFCVCVSLDSSGFKAEGKVCAYDRKLGRSWLGLGSPLEAELFCVSRGFVWGASVCYG